VVKPNEYTINSVAELVEFASKSLPCAHWKFRGHENSDWTLASTLGRMKKYIDAANDKRLAIEGEILCRTFGSLNPSASEHRSWLLAAISAQHHGAPTRLLDWSDSLLTAAYFATKPSLNNKDGTLKQVDCDAAIWAIHICPEYESFDALQQYKSVAEFEARNGDSIVGFYPPATTTRVLSQQSYFTLTKDPCVDLGGTVDDGVITHINKMILPRDKIRGMQLELFRLGVRHKNLFADQDGHNSSIWQDIEISEQLKNSCNAGEANSVST
jgi:FRG domain